MSARTRFDAGERAAARRDVGGGAQRALLPGERWADEWRAELAASPDDVRARWEALLAVSATATQPRATAEWNAAGVEVVEAVGVDALRAAVSAATARLSGADLSPLDGSAQQTVVADRNATVLRGLVRLLMLQPWPQLPQLLGALCTTCMVPVTGMGPRAQKVANTCIASLGALAASPDAELRANATLQLELTSTNILDRATKVAITTALDSAKVKYGARHVSPPNRTARQSGETCLAPYCR